MTAAIHALFTVSHAWAFNLLIDRPVGRECCRPMFHSFGNWLNQTGRRSAGQFPPERRASSIVKSPYAGHR